MKKILTMLFIALTFVVINNGVIYGLDDIGGVYRFDIDGNEATIEGFQFSFSPTPGYNVVIPSTVSEDGVTNYTVVEVHNNAFEANANIQTITIPNTVERIGFNAFAACISVDSLSIEPGSSLKVIDDGAFQATIGLSGNFIAPDSLEEIGMRAFWSSGFTGITLPTVVKTGYIFSNWSYINGTTGMVAATHTGGTTVNEFSTDQNASYEANLNVDPNMDARLNSMSVNDSRGRVSYLPLFSQEILTYNTLSINGVTDESVMFELSLSNSAASVTVDGVTKTGAGTLELDANLALGDNTIDVIVTAQDGVTTRTYQMDIFRRAIGTDATLSDITLDGVDLSEGFAPNTFEYTEIYPETKESVIVDANPTDYRANITSATINGVTLTSPVLDLEMGLNVLEATVTAEDGVTQNTYIVNIYRGNPPVAEGVVELPDDHEPNPYTGIAKENNNLYSYIILFVIIGLSTLTVKKLTHQK